jgi:hypothetical protein
MVGFGHGGYSRTPVSALIHAAIMVTAGIRTWHHLSFSSLVDGLD